MALPPLASCDDLATWLGSDVDPARADAILSAASTLIRTHSGRVWVDAAGEAEATASDLQLEAVKVVAVHVAARVYQNPKGHIQQGTGPFSEAMSAWFSLGLALTDEEKSLLSGPAGPVPGLSSVKVVAPADATGTPRWAWCDEVDS